MATSLNIEIVEGEVNVLNKDTLSIIKNTIKKWEKQEQNEEELIFNKIYKPKMDKVLEQLVSYSYLTNYYEKFWFDNISEMYQDVEDTIFTENYGKYILKNIQDDSKMLLYIF